MLTPEQLVLGIILPEGVLEWFNVIEGKSNDNSVRITLEEKNIPPLEDKTKKIISKGFKDITITDFPIRGKQTFLTFRRRYWQLEDQKELLKRDIQLASLGTQLETEFAAFLKANS